jgi:hypothetical protein
VADQNESYLLPDGTLHQGCIEGLLKACQKAHDKVTETHQKHFFADLSRALEELLHRRAKDVEGKTKG